MPSLVNIPAATTDDEFDLTIHRETPETRRAKISEKAAASKEKRILRYVALGVLLVVLACCLYVALFSHKSEPQQQFAEKLAYAIVGFLGGNAVPKLFEGDEKEK